MRRRWKVALGILAILVLALGINAFFVGRETKPAERGDGRILRLSGGDLNVKVQGRASGSPLVLLHGFAASSDWWDDVAARLVRTHRVISIDLLGHGNSQKPSDGYSMENQARLVAEAMRRLGAEDARSSSGTRWAGPSPRRWRSGTRGCSAEW